MNLNDTYYYCFGCGATGDVIDLTARLFDLSSLQAARKLVRDFGLGPDKPPSGAVALPKPLATFSDTNQEDIAYCLRVLHDYRDLLTRWQTEFAPLSPEEPLDEHFVEALHMMAVVDDLIDCLAFGPASKKAAAAKRLLDGQLLPMVESRLNSLDRKPANKKSSPPRGLDRRKFAGRGRVKMSNTKRPPPSAGQRSQEEIKGGSANRWSPYSPAADPPAWRDTP